MSAEPSTRNPCKACVEYRKHGAKTRCSGVPGLCSFIKLTEPCEACVEYRKHTPTRCNQEIGLPGCCGFMELREYRLQLEKSIKEGDWVEDLHKGLAYYQCSKCGYPVCSEHPSFLAGHLNRDIIISSVVKTMRKHEKECNPGMQYNILWANRQPLLSDVL